jgi:hypothetical protein
MTVPYLFNKKPFFFHFELEVTGLKNFALRQLQDRPEPEFEGAQESIPPAYVAWRAGTITLFDVPARQAT